MSDERSVHDLIRITETDALPEGTAFVLGDTIPNLIARWRLHGIESVLPYVCEIRLDPDVTPSADPPAPPPPAASRPD